jgi:hypothetical protein
MERAAEGSFPYWVALLDEKCTGANHEKIREFCQVNGLTLSRFGHAVVWEKEWYQVFRFGRLEDADHFIRELGGERMHPDERGVNRRPTWTPPRLFTKSLKQKRNCLFRACSIGVQP